MFKTYLLRANLQIEFEISGLNKEQAVLDWMRAYPLPMWVVEDSLHIISVNEVKPCKQ